MNLPEKNNNSLSLLSKRSFPYMKKNSIFIMLIFTNLSYSYLLVHANNNNNEKIIFIYFIKNFHFFLLIINFFFFIFFLNYYVQL